MPARMRPRLFLVAASTAVALAATGCASSSGRTQVSAAATSFVRAIEAADGPVACRMLTSDARRSASGATDTQCSDAILSITEQGEAVHGVQVWGDAAQVRIAQDVIFLRHISGSWQVSAAGCKPQRQGPYQCTVGS
jgi:hypothetical protein